MSEEPKIPRTKLVDKGEEFYPGASERENRRNSSLNITLISNYTKEMMLFPKYSFKNDILRLPSYSDMESIKATFPPLFKINPKDFDKEVYAAAYYMKVQTSDYDDIHKAMKYGLWSSSEEINNRISSLYQKAQKEEKKLYLVWQADTSENIVGVSEVVRDFDKDYIFNLWHSKEKAMKGVFYLIWTFVKTLDITTLQGSFFGIKDGDEIDGITGLSLMHEFTRTRLEGSIFDLFNVMDLREDNLFELRKNIGVEIKLTKVEFKNTNKLSKNSGRLHSGVNVLRKGSQKRKRTKSKNENVLDEDNGEIDEPKRKKRQRRRKNKRNRSDDQYIKKSDLHHPKNHDSKEDTKQTRNDNRSKKSRRRKRRRKHSEEVYFVKKTKNDQVEQNEYTNEILS